MAHHALPRGFLAMATEEYSVRITVNYGGKSWHRYPNAKKASDRNYFIDSFGKKLHRFVWEEANGPIPDKHDIHHIDNDPTNNNVANLECLSKADHRQRHPVKDIEKSRQHMARMREIGADWHKSEEAKPSKSRASRIAWERFTPIPRICQHCSSPFLDRAWAKEAAYCSSACRSYVQQHRSAYRENGICVICGSAFDYYKHMATPTVTCGRSCSARLAHQTKRAKREAR